MVLAIYGSGGQGRETLELARTINEMENRWNEVLFIDDAVEKQGMVVNGQPVISFEQFLKKYTKDTADIVIALGEPQLRYKKYVQIKEQGYNLATLIYPGIKIPDTTKIGEGVIINIYDFISCNVEIGDNTLIQGSATIGHDCVIGKHSVLSTYAYLGGACKVGDRAYISLNAPIYQGVTIGNDSIVGMGSVVREDVPDNVVVVGSPAKIIRKNDNKMVFTKV